MQELLVEFSITIAAFLFTYQIYRSNLSYNWKMLFLALVFFQAIINLFLWTDKFNVFLSLIILLFSSFFIQQLLFQFRETYIYSFDLSVESPLHSLWFLFKNYLQPLSASIGILFLFLIFLAEYFLLDGLISSYSLIVILTSLSWLVYSYVPKIYNHERDFIFILFNIFSIILLIPHIIGKFFGLTFISPILLSALLFWMIYNNISENYGRERDFLFVFLNALVILFVLPRLFYDISTIFGLSEYRDWFDGGELTNVFLTRPLSNLLSILGFNVWADGQLLHFEDLTTNRISTVSVAKQCSGLYSMGIFSAALVSFMYAENKRFDKFTFLILCSGLFIAYFANLIRMAIIVVVGHYWGMDALEWTHENVGWIIFTAWIALFWFILDKYILTKKL